MIGMNSIDCTWYGKAYSTHIGGCGVSRKPLRLMGWRALPAHSGQFTTPSVPGVRHAQHSQCRPSCWLAVGHGAIPCALISSAHSPGVTPRNPVMSQSDAIRPQRFRYEEFRQRAFSCHQLSELQVFAWAPTSS
jgi:hypothetical protein